MGFPNTEQPICSFLENQFNSISGTQNKNLIMDKKRIITLQNKQMFFPGHRTQQIFIFGKEQKQKSYFIYSYISKF